MQSNLTRIGTINLVLLLIVGASGFLLARQGGSFAALAGMVFFAAGLLVAVLSWFQMRLEERERLEKMELEELARSAKGTTLFDTGDAEIFPAQRAREQFERFIVPAATVLLLILQAVGAVVLWQWLQRQFVEPLEQPMLLMALFGMFALILLLIGKYGAKVAQLDRERLLRPGSAYVLLGAAVCFLIALGIGAVEAGFPRADLLLAMGFSILLGLAAVETAVGLVLEIYRPRLKGLRDTRVIYESRIVGLLGQPAGIFHTVAQALDYQFGFKVSDTWFYRFVQRAAVWILLGQAALLLLSTCVVFIDAGEQAVFERNGKPVAGREVLGPGIHLKLPWPIDSVHRERTLEVRSFVVGIVPDHDKSREKIVLWTVSHSQEEYNLLVASREPAPGGTDQAPPVNLLSVSIPVQYQIKDLLAWTTGHANATNLLEKVATREVVTYLVSVDFFEMMSIGRDQAAIDLKRRIQEEADKLRLGVDIVFVGLQDVHPPIPVGADFNAVLAAYQEKLAIVEGARTYAITNVIFARAEATNRIRRAESHRTRVVSATQAQAAQFTNRVKAYTEAPLVYSQRAYLNTLSAGAANSRKIVLAATNAQQIVNLNLEDKTRPDLLDVPVESRQ